ncbi:hypothetical protein FK220_011285 [Flavobacteriaceae bacterium TP-CH-4]|uniref:Uncharacterized protein n=1 Tax=Pelagihabitans pacificus TaxID=2696054 RepID=A0A967E5Y5_9FLAO|nr:hypothetical protein [Pelagihabitans pacificus]NHF59927.1 hypothetical protein [Pelagihabitans pacificus]
MANPGYCMIDPEGGPLQVQLSVNNGIKSASLFVLWEKPADEWEQKESFKLVTEDDGVDEHFLLEKPGKLENDVLAWNIQSCAQIDGANRGTFLVSIYQDDKKIWTKASNRKVPYCSSGEHRLFGNEVIFKHKIQTNSRHSELWLLTENP